jgi:hypothetical protein
LELNGRNLKFKIDSGSDVNTIPLDQFKTLNIKNKIVKSNIEIEGYTGHKIEVIGKAKLKVASDKNQYTVEFLIVSGNNLTPILGLNTCIELNILKRIDNIKSETNKTLINKNNFIDENIDIFSGLGFFPEIIKIKLKNNAV